MGNSESKGNFHQAVIDLTSKQSKLEDAEFWGQLLSPNSTVSAKELFDMIPSSDIRSLRENSPNNLATLCYKAVDCLTEARDKMVPASDHKKVINCVRLLTRILPFMFESEEWRNFFWAPAPDADGTAKPIPLASVLLTCIGDLLFCPDFTVGRLASGDVPDSLSTLDSCEYIWQSGVGFTNKTITNAVFDAHRTEILKLLLTCLSEVIYVSDKDENRMRWLRRFASTENRHVLPLFTSLLNVICSYDPVGLGLPYNYLLVNDSREPLVQIALQVLIVCLDREAQPAGDENGYVDNFFINYLSRIHREDDFEFILRGMTRLLNNPLQSSYLPNSVKKVTFHQELLIFLWKCCEYNQKFMYYVLKTSDVLEILVPILYHINDARNDTSRVGLIHMGVFLILLLSGERNFGVRLNKPYISRGNIDVQAFTGTHADLLIIVAHKLITTGNYRLQSLFDCLLTIIVNVSPYLKSLSMVTANKLVHLVEAFSTPWYLFSSPEAHHLVFFLLEVFNNIIQYQFDGNANLIYTIIRKRQVFYQLANLNTDQASISKSLNSRKGKGAAADAASKIPQSPTTETPPPQDQETEKPIVDLNEGPNFQSSLAATPNIKSMTDKTAEWSKKAPETPEENWTPTQEWVESWKNKLPLQTIMRLLQVLVPQVEKICIDKNLTDEGEIIKFLQNGTLVGLLPVPHPLLLRRYQANAGTNHWFRTYMWGQIYLRTTDPPVWYDTEMRPRNYQGVSGLPDDRPFNCARQYFWIGAQLYAIMSYNYLFKIVVVGDHNCGKSCILLRFAENTFRADHISTLGVDFKLKTVKLGRDKIRLELWDTAGMERYRTIYNSYYHSAHGIMCVYDLTNERSFENLENYWLKEIRNNAPQNAVLLLVGNKADMEGERKVEFDRAERLAKRIGVSLYEVSAKTGINCDEAFMDLASAMRDRLLVSNMHSDSDESDQYASAFHIDGVIADEKLINGRNSVSISCCSSAPSPTFV